MPERRKTWGRVLLAALAVGAVGAFAYLNAGERVSLHLGLFVLYRVSLVALVLISFLLGMVAMFLVGLRQDLRVRRLLRQHEVQEERRAWGSGPPPDPSPPPPDPSP